MKRLVGMSSWRAVAVPLVLLSIAVTCTREKSRTEPLAFPELPDRHSRLAVTGVVHDETGRPVHPGSVTISALNTISARDTFPPRDTIGACQGDLTVEKRLEIREDGSFSDTLRGGVPSYRACLSIHVMPLDGQFSDTLVSPIFAEFLSPPGHLSLEIVLEGD